MVDLHMHTTYSDGTDNVENILKKAEMKKLSVISITDHNNCNSYNELRNMDIKQFYTGKIVCGVELSTKALGIPIEILGYNLNPDIVNALTKITYLTAKERNFIELKRLYEKCVQNGLELPDDFVDKFDGEMFASKYLHNEMTKNDNNKKLIDEESWNNSNIFYRRYMSNPNTIFYVNTDDIVPDLSEAIKIVKDAGGLVFIPHIFEYRENSINILNHILDNYNIDGLECFYSTFTKEQSDYVLNICKEKGLYISGGSDYHGTFKPDVDMGNGKGNLQVEEKYVQNWVENAIWYK